MLFFCSWADRASLLVDGADEADAREVATEVAEGDAPSRLVPLPPRAFVAEVAFDDEDALVIEPLDHVADLLDELDASADEGLAPDVPRPLCGSSAESEDGETVFCMLDAHGGGAHKAKTSGGAIVEWSDDEEAAATA